MDMEKGKRISTLVTDLEIEPVCVFQLIVILILVMLPLLLLFFVKKLALFCLAGKDAMFIVTTLIHKQGPDLLK